MSLLQTPQSNPIQEIAQGWIKYVEETPGEATVVTILAVLTLFVVFGILRRLLGPRGARFFGYDLFRHLCQENGLTRREMRALRRLAAHYELRNPEILFVRRSLFESGTAGLQIDPVIVSSLRRKLYEV